MDRHDLLREPYTTSCKTVNFGCHIGCDITWARTIFYRDGVKMDAFSRSLFGSNKDDIGWHWISTISMPHSQRNLGKRWMGFTILGTLYLGFAFFSLKHKLPVFCPYRRIFGRPCPLCGLTTATGYLLHGQWPQAIDAHPLSQPVILGAATGWYVADCAAVLRTQMRQTAEATN